MKGIQTAFGDVNFEAAIQSGMLELAIKQHGFNQAIASPQFEAALNKNLVTVDRAAWRELFARWLAPSRGRCQPPFVVFAVLAILGFPQLTFAQLAVLETAGLRLVYLDPSETFLVPHAARTFLNSLEFQRKILDFEPRDPVTVLLTDFADAGNAGATVVPRNAVTVDIAPLNSAFETIAGNERMNIIMNHELVHLSTMDPPSSGDRAFRKLFGGKVMPVEEQPETILYFLLTTPRVAAPRWYHEGIAVFLDTWMAGGLGRAQGGYDEMVFRSMVRDGTPHLRSAGSRL